MYYGLNEYKCIIYQEIQRKCHLKSMTWLAFIINNLTDHLLDDIDQKMKKSVFVAFYHCDAQLLRHYIP